MKSIQIVVLFATTLLLFSACAKAPGVNERDYAKAMRQIAALEAENTALTEEIAGLRADAAETPETPETPPENAILESLLAHPELIPIEGSLGGAMRYYPDQCGVLSDRYAFAYAEDGHMAVEMLLRYQPDGADGYDWMLELYNTGDGWKKAE